MLGYLKEWEKYRTKDATILFKRGENFKNNF
jgi:hypothetical protein